MKDGDKIEKIRGSLMFKLGYELRIGNKYNYYDTENSDPISVEICNILHDGYYVVYEFKYKNFDGNLPISGIGATIYPDKLKPL